MPGSNNNRIVWLDFARVAAILLVIGFHVVYEFTLDQGLRPYGFVGASLFFIISGFALAMRYPGLVSFNAKWMLGRWLKISSLYYPALLLVALLFGAQIYSGTIGDILLHFSFMNWIGHAAQYTLISPAWFMVPLIGLYILYPYLNLLTKTFRPFLLLAVMAALTIRLMEGTLISFSPLFFMAEFCFGIAMAHGRRDFWLLSPILLSAAYPVMAVPFALFFLFSLMPDFGSKAVGRALSIAGKSTMALFLFHESVMKTALGKWSVLGLGVVPGLAVLLAGIAVALLLSNYIQTLIPRQEPKKAA